MIVAVLLIVFGQEFIFNKFSAYETIGFIVSSLLISYITFFFLGIDYPKFFVKALYFITIVSLLFYFSSVFSPAFYSYIKTIPKQFAFLDEHKRQFILHSVSHAVDDTTGILRHNGVFHEPGVFGLFLTIGLYFNYITFNKIFNKYGAIFIIAILTTFSTATFLATGVLILGIVFSIERYNILKYPLFIIIGVAFVYFFFNSQIMYQKIAFEYERDMSKTMEQTTAGRIYGARKSFYVIQKYPLTGRGLCPITRAENKASPEFVRYGILHEFAKIGIPMALMFIYFLCKGIFIYGRIYKESKITIFFIIALLINLLSQSFAFTPVVMSFVFVGIFSNKYKLND